MNTIDESHRKVLVEVFETFDEHQVQYVVTHGFSHLPESTYGSDIDVLVAPEQFTTAIELCHPLFEADSTARDLVTLVTLVLSNPVETVKYLSSPRQMVERIKKIFFLSDRIKQYQLESVDTYKKEEFGEWEPKNCFLDVQNHFRYKNPFGQESIKIQVDPALSRHVLQHRRRHKMFYVPNPPSELTHLVTRGVCDYRGEFPDYHQERCETLAKKVFHDEEFERQFRELLGYVFFDASRVVYDAVRDGNYEHILDALKQFRDY